MAYSDRPSFHIGDHALQIRSFGNSRHDRMILALAAHLEQADAAMCVACGFSEHGEKIVLAHMMRAGTCDENASLLQHLQGAEIQLLIAAKSGGENPFSFGE